MNKLTATQSPDPRHVYLSQSDLQTRYGRGRTFISQLVNSPGFPRPIVPGRWRFDRILAWEDVQAAAHFEPAPALEGPDGGPASGEPLPEVDIDALLAPRRSQKKVA
ncbi:MAG: hypothetical protein ACRDZ7_08680 [Acidimicrobiia bacterium]